MKIAFLSFYSGHLYRGVETFTDELAKRLSKDKNNQIDVYQSGPQNQKTNYHTIIKETIFPKAWPNDTLADKHILKRFFLHYYKRREFSFFLKTLSDLLNKKYDWIVPQNSGWPVIIIRLITLFTKTKIAFIGHSGPGWDDRWHLLCHPDIFICLTQKQFNWAKKATLWKKQQFAIIPNGVDLKKFSPSGKLKKLSLQKPIICIAAASEKSKNIDKTIKAVSLLKKGSLLVLGKGGLDKEIDKLGKKLLGKNYLHISVANNQMPEYYRACDLFTMCSESSEAFGIVYLEALSCNLPVVATDDQSRRQIIGDAGLYVKDPQDSKEYSNILQKALTKNWGNLPQKQAQKFDWDKIAKEYNDLFLGLYK